MWIFWLAPATSGLLQDQMMALMDGWMAKEALSSKNYKVHDFGHNWDLTIISHQQLRLPYPTRSGCKDKNIQITHVYLMYIPWPRTVSYGTTIEYKEVDARDFEV